MTRKAGVIGWPIAHSRSPLIHGTWLKQFRIDGSYDRWPVKPEELSIFFAHLKSQQHAGCNITIPHKEKAFPFIDEADERAARIGAVNTVWLHDGKIYGTTTDGIGFCNNVEHQQPAFSWRDATVVILGAGGSAVALTDEILRRGAARIVIANRSLERAAAIAKRFGTSIEALSLENVVSCFATADLLVNTTSLGMNGQPPLEINLSRLPDHAIVSDINYVPLKTEFLHNAEARRLSIVTGLGMLLHQAVPGFERWFGKTPVVTQELYDLVASDIGKVR
jgi:shikimate dehydrogenase